MTTQKRMNELQHMPRKIRVRVTKGVSGALLAELPEYDVFTEADTLFELLVQVNDLIYTYFDLPSKYRGKIIYSPPLPEKKVHEEPKIDFNKYYMFQKYIASPEAGLYL
jgi:hypothetical protein